MEGTDEPTNRTSCNGNLVRRMNSNGVAMNPIPGPVSRQNMLVLCCCLFVSGAAGLMYEVLWTRILGLSFGHTTYAVTTVLAVFMGGLALGSKYLGRMADRTSRPLRLYGYLEIGIGIYCLAAPALLAFAREIYITSDFFPEASPLRAVFRFALAFLVLIVPTTLMGGTLPAVSRALVRDAGESGRKIGIFYGVNTLGAAAGAFAAGYWLLPTLGIRMSNFLGAGASLLAGSAVLLLFRGETRIPTFRKSAAKEKPVAVHASERLLLWAFAACGAVGMSYQIVWVRALVLVIGSSTYAFSAILVTFLLGIALGSLAFSRLHARNGFRFFALLQFGIAAFALLLLPTFNLLPRVFFFLFKSSGESHRFVEMIQFLIVMAVVLLPTTLMGMAFPSLTGLLTRKMDHFGGNLGRYYAWNTVGAIAGSVLTGFFLIPHLGAQRTLALGILTNMIIGTVLLLFTVSSRRRIFAGITVLAAVPLLLFPRWDRRIMSSGVFYLAEGVQQLNELTSLRIRDVPFLEEGISSTIAVVRFRNGSKGFLVNGKVDGGDSDIETQMNLATIPLLLHPDPRRVAIIGLGTGVTAGTATLFSRPERIDVVELEPAARKAAEYFSRENWLVLENPRVRLHIEDGRNFFEESDAFFEVVISEPSNPWMRGIANLYTQEFFGKIRERLSPGGIFCQWVQGYSITPVELRMIARTFLEAFPIASVWIASEGDLLFLGRKDGPEYLDLPQIVARVDRNHQLIHAYRSYDEHPVDALLADYILGPRELRRYAGEGPLNTDDLPLLEFSAPRSLYRPKDVTNNRKDIFRYKVIGFPPFLLIPPLDEPALHERIGKYNLHHGRASDAAQEFIKASELGFGPKEIMNPTGNRQVAHIGTSGTLRESFDGNVRSLPLIPRLGGYRPSKDEKADFAIWSANMEYFSAISGLMKGVGTGNSDALVLQGVAGVISSAYYVPLAVHPLTTYQVELSMKSMLDNTAEAGVGILEYDSVIYGGEHTLRTERRNRIGSKSYLRIRGYSGWEKHSFSFTTSPRTRMAHILFFREGAYSRDPVIFDDILIREIR